MKLNKKFLYAFLIVTFISISSFQSLYAKQLTFIVDNEQKKDNVSFTSDAPIEVIVGTTNNIKGNITLDGLDAKNFLNIDFEVDLASLDTGIPLRNEHMRDNFLETKKYPKASFKIKSISTKEKSLLEDGKKLNLIASGDFTVHGVTVKKDIPVSVTYMKESEITHPRFPKGDVIRIQSTFNISLEEHKIKRPEIVFQKLANEIIVKIDAFANAR